METSIESRRVLDPFQITALIWILLSVGFTFYLAMTNPLNEDELHDLHQGWELADGSILFEQLTAFPYPANSALASWGFRLVDGRFTGIRINRALAVVFHIAVLLLIYSVAQLMFSKNVALFACFSWSSVGYVIMKGAEVRSVHPALLMVLSSLYLYLRCRLEGAPKKVRFFFCGAAAGLAFLFKYDFLLFYLFIVLFEFAPRLKRPKTIFSADFMALILGSILVPTLYLASFENGDRIIRYLFFQYQLFIYSNTFPEARWLKYLVIRYWAILPLTVAALMGVWFAFTRRQGKGKHALLIGMLVFEALVLSSVVLRKIYFQQNFLLPTLVPALFAGAGFDSVNLIGKWKRNRFQWILLIAMMGCAAASVFFWNHRGSVRFTHQFYYDEFNLTVPGKERCRIPVDALLGLRGKIAVDWHYYHLSLNDHEHLYRFLEALDGATLSAYDGFEAATNVRGAPFLNGFTNSTFREDKYQGVYEMVRGASGGLLRRMTDSGWRLFHDMSPAKGKDALVKELMASPPSVLILDGFLFSLLFDYSDYAFFLDSRYSFFVLPDAHVIVGLRKGLPPPGGPYPVCHPMGPDET